MRPLEARLARHRRDVVTVEFVLQNLDLMANGHFQPLHQIARRDVFFHSVAAAIESALPPAGEIEHRLAQRFARNRPGMEARTANLEHLLDQQHRTAEFGRLNGAALPRRAAAKDDEIIFFHAQPSRIPQAVGPTADKPPGSVAPRSIVSS